MTVRSEIINRAKKLRSEITQIFADADHWNKKNTPWQKAIDPDPDGELKKMAEMLDRVLTDDIPQIEKN